MDNGETIENGNLYKISVMRIPENQDFDDPLSANNGHVEGDVFIVGMIHTQAEDGDSYYIAYSNEKILSESYDLYDLSKQVIKALGKQFELNENEIRDLTQILSIQDDADYDLDPDSWVTSLGDGGEVWCDEDFVNGLIVNVTPYYSTEIGLSGTAGEADDDACVEGHEFCGARKTN